ncbi:MAG: flagellar protein FlaG [Alphaproteobacteria bacterium]
MSDLSVTSIGVSAGASPLRASSQTKVEAANTFNTDTLPSTEPQPAKAQTSHAQQTTHLSIVHDEATNRYVFKSIDPDTGEVIRQYPTEQMLSLIASVRRTSGLTVDKNA